MRSTSVDCNLCGSGRKRRIAMGPDFEYGTTTEESTVVECLDCGLAYLDPRPHAAELGRIYPPDYIPYRFDEHLPGLVNRMRMLVQRFKVMEIRKIAAPGATIWDVGCGGGIFLECLRAYGDPSWRLAGVDIAAPAVEKIRHNGFTGIQGRFESLAAAPATVDVIVLNQVLEHLEDPRAVLRKAHELLAEGGFLFLEIPSLDGWDAALFRGRHWGGWHFPRHWTLFSRRTISEMLDRCGFAMVRRKWLLSPNFWIQSIHHWMTEKPSLKPFAGWVDCRNPLLLALFCAVDLLQTVLAEQSSNLQIIARKKPETA